MKNDVSHHGILLNLIFAQFCRIFPEKTGFRIRKTGYPIQKFICVKTYLVQGEYYPKISAKLVKLNNTLKSRFFRISGKTGSRIRKFFSLKPSPDQYGANKKRFSQIGPAVPEWWWHTHTDIQTYRQKPLLLCSIDYTYIHSTHDILGKVCSIHNFLTNVGLNYGLSSTCSNSFREITHFWRPQWWSHRESKIEW